MESFLSNRELVAFSFTSELDVRKEEQIEKELDARYYKAFLFKVDKTFSYHKGTNIKHGPFFRRVERGFVRYSGEKKYTNKTEFYGTYIDGVLARQEELYFYKHKEDYQLRTKTTVPYRDGKKHGVQVVEKPSEESITILYIEGKKIKPRQPKDNKEKQTDGDVENKE
nr:hypothetical protein MarFTME_046 [Marseillevirus futianmevirus]